MKLDKNLQKTVSKLIQVSFENEKIVESQVTKSIKLLKTLPSSEAITALTAYLVELKRKQRMHTMYIETITPLSTTQLKKLKNIISKDYKITQVIAKINPEILGGFRLRVGDEVFDESIDGKVEQLKEVIRG